MTRGAQVCLFSSRVDGVSRTVWGHTLTLTLLESGARVAEFAGLRTVRATVLSYVLTGVLAAVAGVLLSSRTNAAKSD